MNKNTGLHTTNSCRNKGSIFMKLGNVVVEGYVKSVNLPRILNIITYCSSYHPIISTVISRVQTYIFVYLCIFFVCRAYPYAILHLGILLSKLLGVPDFQIFSYTLVLRYASKEQQRAFL